MTRRQVDEVFASFFTHREIASKLNKVNLLLFSSLYCFKLNRSEALHARLMWEFIGGK